jgi:hypothetical protein
MNDLLEKKYLADAAIAIIERQLILNAVILFRNGFKKISSSQMAAATDFIQNADTVENAKKAITEFINHQIKKLKSKQDRSGKAESWKLTTASGDQTLGECLIQWIQNDLYLKDLGADSIRLLAHLSALQRFWSYFYGYYRYEAEFQKEMHLTAIEEQRKS